MDNPLISLARSVSRGLLYNPESKRPFPNSPYYAYKDAGGDQEKLRDLAMNMIVAGTIRSPENLAGNQPKIVGTLIDVKNFPKLSVKEQIDALTNLRNLGQELVPKFANSRDIAALESGSPEKWMYEMAKALSKKTGLTSISGGL